MQKVPQIQRLVMKKILRQVEDIRDKGICYLLHVNICTLNPFVARTAIWRFEVITHAAMYIFPSNKALTHFDTRCAYSKISTPIWVQEIG